MNSISWIGLFCLIAVCTGITTAHAQVQLDPGTLAAVNASVALQLNIDQAAYGGSCNAQLLFVDNAQWIGLTCGPEPDGSQPWGCNFPGLAEVNVTKCQTDPQNAPGENFVECLEEAACHEMTEACYNGGICDARKTTFWNIGGQQLADCDYPEPGQIASIGGCQDLICFWDSGGTANPTPTPSASSGGPCLCPTGWFALDYSPFCAKVGSYTLLPCGNNPNPQPTPTPQPTATPTPMVSTPNVTNPTPTPSTFSVGLCSCPAGWFALDYSPFCATVGSYTLLPCGQNPTPQPPPTPQPMPTLQPMPPPQSTPTPTPMVSTPNVTNPTPTPSPPGVIGSGSGLNPDPGAGGPASSGSLRFETLNDVDAPPPGSEVGGSVPATQLITATIYTTVAYSPGTHVGTYHVYSYTGQFHVHDPNTQPEEYAIDMNTLDLFSEQYGGIWAGITYDIYDSGFGPVISAHLS